MWQNCKNICKSMSTEDAGISQHRETGTKTKLIQEYKFYLAFENSICRDYVTEKFFQRMKQGIVPVVFGGADYSSIAPTHSYIDVKDFDTPKDLADYLIRLDKR